MAAEESVTNYFSYVKNVLGVKTIQSARLRQNPTDRCDLLFLNLQQPHEKSIFAPECAELLDKMIQAMRLGDRRYLILECPWNGENASTAEILQEHRQKVSTSFAVLFSTKPVQGAIQNLGPLPFLESYSPSYLLQNPPAKKVAWNDLQRVMKQIGIL